MSGAENGCYTKLHFNELKKKLKTTFINTLRQTAQIAYIEPEGTKINMKISSDGSKKSI